MLQTTFTIPRSHVANLNDLLEQINRYFETNIIGMDHQVELYGPNFESFNIEVTRPKAISKDDEVYSIRITYVGQNSQDKDIKSENKNPGSV